MLRRADITVSVHHSNNLQKVKAIILEVVNADSRILQNPAPLVLIKDLTSEAVLISVLFWTSNADYGFAVSDFYENLKKQFQEQEISIPASNQVVTIKNIDLLYKESPEAIKANKKD